MTNITSVSASFENGIKREEYGPMKKASASITASVAENEDGEAVLARIGELALAQVAALLDAPKPAVAAQPAAPKEEPAAGEPPARRGRGRPKKEDAEPATGTPSETDTPSATSETVTESENAQPDTPAEDEWSADAGAVEINDAELLAATSKRAGELGAREPIVKLIATFATRTEGAPFKVQEIPQPQRKDYLNKLAALTA